MLKQFETYQLAKELYRSVQRIPANRHERDQMARAALSVVLNLAEGSAKPTGKERRRFYAISFGSLREVQALLEILDRPEEAKLADRIGGCLFRLTRPRTDPAP